MPETTHLWCRNPAQNIDKVYTVTLDSGGEAPQAFTVTARWGRRGGTLSTRIKYQGNDLAQALRIRVRLIQAKLRRGYQIQTETGAQTPLPPAEAANTRVPLRRRRSASILSIEAPRLQEARSIDQGRLAELLADPRWCAQPALAGDRRIIRIRLRGSSTLVDAIGADRSPVVLPEEVVIALRTLSGHEALLDARIEGVVAWISDLLYYAERREGSRSPGIDWLTLPYWKRLEQLQELLPESLGAHVRVVPTAWSRAQKHDLARERRRLGLVLREIEALYAGGDSAHLVEYRHSA